MVKAIAVLMLRYSEREKTIHDDFIVPRRCEIRALCASAFFGRAEPISWCWSHIKFNRNGRGGGWGGAGRDGWNMLWVWYATVMGYLGIYLIVRWNFGRPLLYSLGQFVYLVSYAWPLSPLPTPLRTSPETDTHLSISALYDDWKISSFLFNFVVFLLSTLSLCFHWTSRICCREANLYPVVCAIRPYKTHDPNWRAYNENVSWISGTNALVHLAIIPFQTPNPSTPLTPWDTLRATSCNDKVGCKLGPALHFFLCLSILCVLWRRVSCVAAAPSGGGFVWC